MRGKPGRTFPFQVAVRVDMETMTMLDFIRAYEGYTYGEFCRMALEDYLSGVTMNDSGVMRAYRDWRSGQSAKGKLSMQQYIGKLKLQTPIR